MQPIFNGHSYQNDLSQFLFMFTKRHDNGQNLLSVMYFSVSTRFFNWLIFARCNAFLSTYYFAKQSFNPKFSFVYLVKYISCYKTTSTKCLTWFDLKYTQLILVRDPCHLKMHSRKLSKHVTKCQNIANNDVNSWELMRSASVLRDRTTNLQIKITRIK